MPLIEAKNFKPYSEEELQTLRTSEAGHFTPYSEAELQALRIPTNATKTTTKRTAVSSTAASPTVTLSVPETTRLTSTASAPEKSQPSEAQKLRDTIHQLESQKQAETDQLNQKGLIGQVANALFSEGQKGNLFPDYDAERTKEIDQQILNYKQRLYYAENDEAFSALPPSLQQKVKDYTARNAAAQWVNQMAGAYKNLPGNSQILLKDGKRYTVDEVLRLANEIKPSDYSDLIDDLDAVGVDGKDLVNYIQLRQGQEYVKLDDEEQRQAAQKYPALTSALTVAATPFQIGGAFDAASTALSNAITGEERPADLSQSDYIASRFRGNTREQIAEDIDNPVGSFLYQTGMSMADFLATAPLALLPGGQAAVTLMTGGGAATDTVIDVTKRGGTASQAALSGWAAGAAEAAFERFSLDAFIKPKSVGSVKTFIANILKGAGVEGSEEMATEIVNLVSDQLIMGDKSNYSMRVQEYVQSGQSREQAEKAALLDMAKQVGLAFAGGALSGGLIHSVQSGADYIGNRQVIQDVKSLRTSIHKAQDDLIAALHETLDSTRAEIIGGGMKSSDSMVQKVLRKQAAGEMDYTARSMKDHARAAVLLRDFSEVSSILSALKKRFPSMTGEAFLEQPLNDSGYRGVHLTVPMGNGVNAEIQIHTPESWNIKKQTDSLYEKWRNIPVDSLTGTRFRAYQRDMSASKRLYEDWYSGITPEVMRAASSSVKSLADIHSPSTPLNSSQTPSVKTSTGTWPTAANNFPSSDSANWNMAKTPFQTNSSIISSVSQDEKNSKPAEVDEVAILQSRTNRGTMSRRDSQNTTAGNQGTGETDYVAFRQDTMPAGRFDGGGTTGDSERAGLSGVVPKSRRRDSADGEAVSGRKPSQQISISGGGETLTFDAIDEGFLTSQQQAQVRESAAYGYELYYFPVGAKFNDGSEGKTLDDRAAFVFPDLDAIFVRDGFNKYFLHHELFHHFLAKRDAQTVVLFKQVMQAVADRQTAKAYKFYKNACARKYGLQCSPSVIAEEIACDLCEYAMSGSERMRGRLTGMLSDSVLEDMSRQARSVFAAKRKSRAAQGVAAANHFPSSDSANWNMAKTPFQTNSSAIFSVSQNEKNSMPAGADKAAILPNRANRGTVGIKGGSDHDYRRFIRQYREAAAGAGDGRRAEEMGRIRQANGEHDAGGESASFARIRRPAEGSSQRQTEGYGGQIKHTLANGNSISYRLASEIVPGSEVEKAIRDLQSRGVRTVVTDGPYTIHQNEREIIHSEAVTAPDGTIYISNDAKLPGEEIASHEFAHVLKYKNSPLYDDFYEVLRSQMNWGSATYKDVAMQINDAYYDGCLDIKSLDSVADIFTELTAYLHQFIQNDPAHAQQTFAAAFRDWDAVVAASHALEAAYKQYQSSSNDNGSVKTDQVVAQEYNMQMSAEAAVQQAAPSYVVRKTGKQYGIADDVIHTAAMVAEQTGRRIEFVETLGTDRNGVYDPQTDTLYIAADTKKTIRTVLGHELTHSLEWAQTYSELSDYVASWLVSETGIDLEEILEAQIAEYAQYHVTLDRNGAMTELVADFVGEKLFTDEATIRRLVTEKPRLARRFLNWVRSIKTKLVGTPQEKELAKVEKLYHRILMEPRQNRGGEQYSIQTNLDGSRYVRIDTDQDIFDGVPRREWTKLARKYIKDKFVGKTLALGEYDAAYMPRKTAGEYTNPSKPLPMNTPVFEAKMKAATELDTLMEAAKYSHWAPDQKSHPEASEGWDYYTVQFELDGRIFEGLINIASGKDSRKFYDITKVREVPAINDEPVATLAQSSPVFRNLSTNTTVSQDTSGVNTNIRENVPNDTSPSVGTSSGDMTAEVAAQQAVPSYSESTVHAVVNTANRAGQHIELQDALGEHSSIYDANTGTLQIALDGQNPAMSVVEQDMIRGLEGTKAYKELTEYVLNLAAREIGVDADIILEAKLLDSQYRFGEPMGKIDAAAAIVADYLNGNLLADSASIQQLADEMPSTARRVLNQIRDTKARLANTSDVRILTQAENLYHDALMNRSKARNVVPENKLQSNELHDRIKTENGGANDGGEGVYLRDGGQRNGSAYSAGQVSRVEEGAGRAPGRQAENRRKDGETASLTFGEKISAKTLGIKGGSSKAAIRIVTGGDTNATRRAKAIADEHNLQLTLFAGDNLDIRLSDGSWASARSYIVGNRVFVRVDHPTYTADQLMRHEAGHDMIRKGEIDPGVVRERIGQVFGPARSEMMVQMYVDAYAGTGMTAAEVWDEIICDSLGSMNIFSGLPQQNPARLLLAETQNEVQADTAPRAYWQLPVIDVGTEGKPSLDLNHTRRSHRRAARGRSMEMETMENNRWERLRSFGENLPDVWYAFTAKYVYAYSNDTVADYVLLGKVPITDSNRELVDGLIKEVQNGTYERTKTLDSWIEDFRRSARRNNWHHAGAAGTESTGRDDGVDVRPSKRERVGHSPEIRGNRDLGEINVGLQRADSNERHDKSSKFSRELASALREGEMLNEFHSEVNWPAYYQKLMQPEYNPANFDDGECAVMHLDGKVLTLKMQRNGEFSVIEMEDEYGQGSGDWSSPYDATMDENIGRGDSGFTSANVENNAGPAVSGDRDIDRIRSGESGRRGSERGREDRPIDRGVPNNERGNQSGAAVYKKRIGKKEKFSRELPTLDALGSNRELVTSNNSTEQKAGLEFSGSAFFNVDNSQTSVNSGGDVIAELRALVEQYGAIKRGESPGRDIQFPRRTDGQTKLRQFARTAAEATAIPDGFVDGIAQDILDGVYNYVPISNPSAMNRATQTVEDLGLDKALEQWDALVNGDKRITKYDMALGEYLLTLAGQNNDPELASKLILDLSTIATNSAQVTQAASMLKRMGPSGQLMSLQRVADRLNRNIQRRRKGAGNASDTVVKIPETIVEKMQKADPRDTEVVDKIYQDGLVSIAKQVPATLIDKWNAWRYLAMLGNPRTHIRNVVGNAAFAPVVYTRNVLAGAIETVWDKASKAAGGKGIARTKTALASLPFTQRQAYKAVADESYKRNKQALNSSGKYSPENIVQANRPVFTSKIGKPLEWGRKGNSAALEAEDGWFKKRHYQRALMQYLAANEVDVAGMDKRTLQQAENYATRQALQATFSDDSAFADFLNHAAKSNKAAGVIIEGIIPFKKTPINIAKRAVEYSPAGLIDTLTRKAYQLKTQEITPAEFAEGLSSGMVGTAIMGLGMWLASKGILTGGLGDDKEDEFAKLQGEQEYAINIDDTSYTLDWASPVALPLFVGAEIFNLYQESKEGEVPLSKMLEALTNLTEPMVNMSMLQGINDSIENVKYSDNELTNMAIHTMTGYVGQAIPTLLGQIARTSDNTRRRNYVEPGSAFSNLQMEFQRNKSKIPGALQTQEPYVDAWGREEPTGNVAQRVFSNFVSPGYSSQKQASAMEKELERLYGAIDDKTEYTILPSAAGKSFQNGGEKYTLAADEYTTYQRTIGATAYDVLSQVIASSFYQAMTDKQRAYVVDKVYEYASNLGKKEILNERGVEYKPTGVTKNIEAAERNGVPVATYFEFAARAKDITADKDSRGETINGSRKRKIEALLKEMGVTSRQQQVLLAIEGYGSERQREQILGAGTGSDTGSFGSISVQESAIDKLLKEALS